MATVWHWETMVFEWAVNCPSPVFHSAYYFKFNLKIQIKQKTISLCKKKNFVQVFFSILKIMGRSCSSLMLFICSHAQVENVVLEIPMPKTVLNCVLNPTQGKYTFDPVSRVLVWDVGRIDTNKLPNIRGSVSTWRQQAIMWISIVLFQVFLCRWGCEDSSCVYHWSVFISTYMIFLRILFL